MCLNFLPAQPDSLTDMARLIDRSFVFARDVRKTEIRFEFSF